MWGGLGAGRRFPVGAAYPPEGTVGAAGRIWREAGGPGDVGLHWPAEAEGQAPPCAIRSEGDCCRTKTKRGRRFRGPPLLDLQVVTGIGRWACWEGLGVTWASPSSSRRPQEEGTARAGAGERLAALAPEDWAGGWVQVQTQSQGLWPAPSPQPQKLGNSRNRTEWWERKE